MNLTEFNLLVKGKKEKETQLHISWTVKKLNYYSHLLCREPSSCILTFKPAQYILYWCGYGSKVKLHHCTGDDCKFLTFYPAIICLYLKVRSYEMDYEVPSFTPRNFFFFLLLFWFIMPRLYLLIIVYFVGWSTCARKGHILQYLA